MGAQIPVGGNTLNQLNSCCLLDWNSRNQRFIFIRADRIKSLWCPSAVDAKREGILCIFLSVIHRLGRHAVFSICSYVIRSYLGILHKNLLLLRLLIFLHWCFNCKQQSAFGVICVTLWYIDAFFSPQNKKLRENRKWWGNSMYRYI